MSLDIKRRSTAKGRRFSGSWATLSSLFKGACHMAQMSEGRRSQVILLDERRLDIIIQSRLYAGELLDIVASHFNLKEKEYFGIAFIDDTGQYSWLQLDKRVLEHDFSKKLCSQNATLIFYFKVKYFIESITQLRDSATIEAFYLQAKSLVSKGELEIDSDITFQLAALVIQATYGDYIDDETFKVHLKRLPVLPTSTLKENSSIAVCEDAVLEHYKALVGQTRGDAIVNYLSILESLPTYGQHYYELKDKSGNPCWLGLSYRGISQYDKNDRRNPKRVFLWKQLENLYFRDRKFTVEVHEARRVVHTLSSFNLYEDAIEEPVEEFDDLSSAICDPTTQVSVSRRALAPANVTVYVWYAASPNIAKCIWSMAIAQHQFYLDRNHRKSRNCAVRNLSQIASELSRSVQSLSPASSQSNISRSTSSASLPTIIIEGELSEESKAATVEMLNALQSRKDALEDALKKKTEELKALCLKEGEIIGELPPETPFQPGDPQPQVRRRIGTSFTLSDKIICRAKNKDRETINNLELDYEIQSKITSAAFRLANDVTARKSVRKLRKISYQQATTKLKDIEEKICTLKREKSCQQDQDTSSNDTVDASRLNLVGLPNSSSENSILERNQSSSSLSCSSVPPSSSLPQLTEGACVSAPASPAKCRQRHQSLQHVITTDVYEDVTLPFNVQARRNSSTHSAASEYDTISCGSSSIASMGLPYRNRFEANLDIEGTNHYSVPNRRASQAFNDPDDLLLDNRSQDTLDRCYVNDNVTNIYANAPALSSSYDERLSYNHPGGFSVIPDNASIAESNFDQGYSENTSNYNDSSFKLAVPYELSRVENFNHSHSENSLHRVRANSVLQKLDQMHISEPDLHVDSSEKENIPHVYSVPMLRNNRPPRATAYVNSLDSVGVTEQSINQVADLVQASVLLQNCKRTMSSSSLQHCSPKTKTKEWVETSLDSPVLTKKRKPKPPEVIHSVDHVQPAPEWLENGLPAVYVNDLLVPYQTQFYDNNELPSNVVLRNSPVPHSMHNRVACPPSYRHSSIFPSHIPSEHSTLDSNGHLPNRNQYHHYENASEIARSTDNYHTLSPSSFYETVQKDSNLNESNLLSVNTGSNETLIEHPGSEQYEDSPLFTRTIAEPQQPPKHPNRRINMSDVYVDESISLPDEPDYQNVPMNHHFESSNYRATPHCTTFPEIHCDIPEPNHQYHQDLPHHSVPQELCDNYDTATEDQGQSWPQFSPTSTVAENSPSSVSQNASFSPTVEVNVVSVGHFQPYWEETKPYELSDFYKYSTKHRKQQTVVTSEANQVQSPSNVKQSSDKKSNLYHDHAQSENSSMYNDYNLPVHPINHNQPELVTNHVPVFGNAEQLESPVKFYDGNCTSTSPNHGEPDKSLSFGELGLGISLADTFHEEMVAWYQKQDNVKKATLV
ncbi:uncharacterized protein LOC129219988 [Uloborus diversus]|uniref:uncharacterized protein LOC129219988 n=1 Tax=Uloborus diversus TaxID=327109 RepID=UPI00240A44E2|nr:uncharacterized protein LOC129219988 [Uloborus diversus]